MPTEAQLKGGFTTTDPRLDRLPEFDERSRAFPVTAHPRFSTALRTKNWKIQVPVLDQGREGACTGFARAQDLAAYPRPAKGINDALAQRIYYLARKHDQWPGEDYEGSSVLGAAKAAVELGYIGEYRWAFGIDDVLAALSSIGPVVVGTDWLDSMFDTDEQGLLDTTGKVAGGHSYLIRGVVFPRNGWVTLDWRDGTRSKFRSGEPILRGPNSWGRDWGRAGEWAMRASQMDLLLQGVRHPGEAAITTSAFVKR